MFNEAFSFLHTLLAEIQLLPAESVTLTPFTTRFNIKKLHFAKYFIYNSHLVFRRVRKILKSDY